MMLCLNPRAEDFERLAVRWTEEMNTQPHLQGLIQSLALFPNKYAENRDKLPQTDSDRAFWLVCKAAEILDGSLYEAQDNADVLTLTATASTYLDEALQLDEECFDALRMRTTLDLVSHEEHSAWLLSKTDQVKEACFLCAQKLQMVPPEHFAGSSVYVRPYLRWLLNLAYEYYICGKYTMALDVCHTLFDLDSQDIVGARLIAAYAYVKLEDEEGLASLIHSFGQETNAWFTFARMAMAYKQRRLEDASQLLRELVLTYELSGTTLVYQEELPPAMFGCHFQFLPKSADELFIAISEAGIILKENGGDFLSPLGGWIATNPIVAEVAGSNGIHEV